MKKYQTVNLQVGRVYRDGFGMLRHIASQSDDRFASMEGVHYRADGACYRGIHSETLKPILSISIEGYALDPTQPIGSFSDGGKGYGWQHALCSVCHPNRGICQHCGIVDTVQTYAIPLYNRDCDKGAAWVIGDAMPPNRALPVVCRSGWNNLSAEIKDALGYRRFLGWLESSGDAWLRYRSPKEPTIGHFQWVQFCSACDRSLSNGIA